MPPSTPSLFPRTEAVVTAPLLGDLLSEERLARLRTMKGKTVEDIEEMVFLQDYLLKRNRRERRDAAQVNADTETQR